VTGAPVVGITCWRRPLPTYLGARTDLVTLGAEYVEAVRAAGGVPLLLPDLSAAEAPAVAARLDALVLSGGGDVAPSAYGGAAAPASDVDPRRDAAELALLRYAERVELPVFGICRGLQLINVAFGGTLVDDIPASDAHPRSSDPDSLWGHRHRIVLGTTRWPGAGLGVSSDGSVPVNSIHHQAIASLGSGLRAVAHSTDGFVEAVETTNDGWFLRAVQWHPEKMHASKESAHGAALLTDLVQAACARTSRSIPTKENV
jgi:putative glutamine amidotransferase